MVLEKYILINNFILILLFLKNQIFIKFIINE
jgi:hypothetical protein